MYAGGLTQLDTCFASGAKRLINQLAILQVEGTFVCSPLYPETTQAQVWKRSYEVTFVCAGNPRAL